MNREVWSLNLSTIWALIQAQAEGWEYESNFSHLTGKLIDTYLYMCDATRTLSVNIMFDTPPHMEGGPQMTSLHVCLCVGGGGVTHYIHGKYTSSLILYI